LADKTFSPLFGNRRPPVPARPAADLGEVMVIGLGRFGSSLALMLRDMGHDVLGVDEDDERIAEYRDALTDVVAIDSTSERALRQIGAAEADTAVVCIGTNIEASVLTAVALVDIGVPNIWAKAINESHARILERVGAHHVVRPEAEMGRRVAHMLSGSVLEYFPLDDDFVIAEMRVPPAIAGRTLGEAALRASHRVTVVVVKPAGGPFTYAERDTMLGEHDLIVVAGHRSDVDRLARA
jgi:trk system potassium uptake protein